MTTVTAEEVATVLAEARAKKSALESEVAALKAEFEAVSTVVNFKRYNVKNSELLRQSSRLILLEQWATRLGFEVAA